jgi:hypothetical protein
VLLENENVLPRAFVPANVRIGYGDADIDQTLVDATDLRECAWISANVPPYERANGPGRVAIRAVGGGGFDLDAEMERDGWVVVSETAWNGWRAYVDGRVKPQRANAAFLSVYLYQGKHRIQLRYRPDSFVRGRAISAVTLLCIVAFAFIRRRSGTYQGHQY